MFAAAAGAAGLGAAANLYGMHEATNAQSRAADMALGEQQRQYDTTRADQAPWRQAGQNAVTQLGGMLQPGGDLTKRFTVADFLNDPVTQMSYKYGLDTGTQALDRMAGARGMRNSGAQLKALTRFGTDYTGQQAAGSQARFVGDQTNLYNRLAGVAGLGQTSVANTGAQGQAAATNAGNIMTSMGNARGAAAIGAGNAISGGISNLGNFYMQNQMMNRLLPQEQTSFTWNG